MKILLVEDDRLIGNGLQVGLNKLGFSVDWFTDGEEGEEALLQTPYDAVIRDIVYNQNTKQVEKDGKPVILSPKETALLEQMLLNRNRVLSKEQLEQKLYSWDEEVSSNAVEVHVHHLRKKLGKDIIKTVNKLGYMLED